MLVEQYESLRSYVLAQNSTSGSRLGRLSSQRLEGMAELRGMSPAKFEALEVKALSAQSGSKDQSEEFHYRARFAAVAQQLRTGKGLSQREVAQRGQISLAPVQRIKDNSL